MYSRKKFQADVKALNEKWFAESSYELVCIHTSGMHYVKIKKKGENAWIHDVSCEEKCTKAYEKACVKIAEGWLDQYMKGE